MKLDVNTLLKVIHKKCLDCCAGMRSELEKCKLNECPLHGYRNLKVTEGANNAD